MRTLYCSLLLSSLTLLLGLRTPVLAQDANVPDSLTLIAHYPLLNSPNDTLGLNGPMLLLNAPYEDNGIRLSGIYTGATDPTGASDAVTPALDALNPDAFAISVEFKMDDVTDAYPVVIGGSLWRWMGAWVFNDSTVYMEGNSYAIIERSTGSIQPGVRHKLTMLYQGAEQKGTWFLDDNEIGSVDNFVLEHMDEKDITVTHTGLGNTFKGIFSNLKVYSYTGTTTALESESLPADIRLAASFPNPFTTTATIRYALPSPQHTRLTVYDALGRRVAVLVDGLQSTGWHEARFQADHLPQGLYVYQLETGTSRQTGHMVRVD